jgi:hypothetical protein
MQAGNCGSVGTCTNIYTKALLVYDEANCWPKSKAVPLMVNSRDAVHSEQLQLCVNTVKHLLGKKPLGAFLRSPVEQLEYVVQNKVIYTCGNTAMKEVNGEKVTDNSKVQYPYLEGEGGGGMARSAVTFAEHTGMCGSWNSDLVEDMKIGQTRYGGTVTTEEYGHTSFDVSIAQYDPEGWIAVQKAEMQAYNRYVANSATGHERDSSWDCHTAATEYYAAGVEMLLYNTRIGENLKAKTRDELKTQEPALWCLSLRHYELNNRYTPCPSGPAISDVTQDVDCRATLTALGVTTFGPDGSNGANGGGAKTNSALVVSSDASCPADASSCAAYSAGSQASTSSTSSTSSASTSSTSSTSISASGGTTAGPTQGPATTSNAVIETSIETSHSPSTVITQASLIALALLTLS